MAESTLSLTRNNLREEVGLKLGYGLNTSGWTPEQISRMDIAIRDGLGRFYFPITGDAKELYEWSFLKITTTLSLTSGAGATYSLPDDCGGIVTEFIITSSGGAPNRIPVIPINDLLQLDAEEAASAAVPKFAAIQTTSPLSPSTTASQRYEVVFYPTPDTNYTASYEYPVHVNSIGSTNAFLPGGAAHSQTIVASCLAVAEQYLTPDETVHQQEFQQRLQASIEYDKRNQQTRRNKTWRLTEPVFGSWDWLRREVAGYLYDEWNTFLLTFTQNAQVESLVNRGVHQFYTPPGMRQGWSFLNILDTTTIEMANGTSEYDLPSGFSELIGDMTLTKAGSYKPIRHVTEEELRISQISEATSGVPQYVVIRSKSTDGSAAHLRQAVFFPTPGSAEAALSPNEIAFRYKVSPAVMSSSVIYPYGHDIHAETMRQSCIRLAAEIKEGADQGMEAQKYQQLLESSKMADINVEVSSNELVGSLSGQE
jgi:hypothetical protein